MTRIATLEGGSEILYRKGVLVDSGNCTDSRDEPSPAVPIAHISSAIVQACALPIASSKTYIVQRLQDKLRV
jgi:hypothetical protein